MSKNNEEFQKEHAELFKDSITISIPPITFPANFNITPADRMALSALWPDKDDTTDAD